MPARPGANKKICNRAHEPDFNPRQSEGCVRFGLVLQNRMLQVDIPLTLGPLARKTLTERIRNDAQQSSFDQAGK